MPPSQLKRLKHSLREQGIFGSQHPKKDKRNVARNSVTKPSYVQRQNTLQGIRDQFNPFEVKANGINKFDITSNISSEPPAIHRPGATKGFGEEKRRKTLFVEMQRRRKTGGITDRRFGEADPEMTPEQKAFQRFLRERERGGQKNAVFNLEEPEDDLNLKHLGRSLSLPARHDRGRYGERESSDPEQSAHKGLDESRPTKRRRVSDALEENEFDFSQDDQRHSRSRSKKEIMEEVIAKSKLHKYGRQKAKEDDDDLRTELDKGLSDLYSMLRGNHRLDLKASNANPLRDVHGSVNVDRLAIIEGKDRLQADKGYDERLRQMAVDQRAMPTVPTLTEEEKLEREAQKIREMEVRRLRRMRGEPEDSDSEKLESDQRVDEYQEQESEPDPGGAFGLGSGLRTDRPRQELGVEDEDEFLIDDDPVAVASDAESALYFGSTPSTSASENEDEDVLGETLDGDDLMEPHALRISGSSHSEADVQTTGQLFHQCPSSLEELLAITRNADVEEVPAIVQRIRLLHHPKLGSETKAKLSVFAGVLVHFIYWYANQAKRSSFTILEALVRHVHSMAKTFDEEVGHAFRLHLKRIQEHGSDSLSHGDLVILTAIGLIFPTSDHFHQVVTPAMLCMTRYLSQHPPTQLRDLAIGTFICTLCLQYQSKAKRYIPEVRNYLLRGICGLLPRKTAQMHMGSPSRPLPDHFQLEGVRSVTNAVRPPLSVWDTAVSTRDGVGCENFKQTLLSTHLALIQTMTTMWEAKSAFCEAFAPVYHVLCLLDERPLVDRIPQDIGVQAQTAGQTLQRLLQKSSQNRKSLQLHLHRPLPIKTSLPKFDESFNPGKHNDPDPERAELSRLKAQHKKERKGALRELRKDARFIAREDLKEKKERDAVYEQKFKRLISEIQGEEGHEVKLYEKEKRRRAGKR